MNILILGATGVTGQHLVSQALDMASDPGFGGGDNWLAMNEAADRTFVTDRKQGMALRKADLYGPSRFDMRHVANVSGSYALPWKDRPGVVGAVVKLHATRLGSTLYVTVDALSDFLSALNGPAAAPEVGIEAIFTRSPAARAKSAGAAVRKLTALGV